VNWGRAVRGEFPCALRLNPHGGWPRNPGGEAWRAGHLLSHVFFSARVR